MGKAKGKERIDKYYEIAKEHGYRSRACWKLIQLDNKFKLLSSSRSVLDLCTAPGSWMQVAVQRVPVGGLVLGVDLHKILPIRGAVSIVQDITKSECKSRIKKVMDEHGVHAFDLILHDGSPNIGGAWAQEATMQNALVVDAVKLASQLLAPKGNFVTKVFRSQDYTSILFCLNQLFEKVEVNKPPASRSTSAEIYVLGLKYKAPAKIDPRLLDVKHLFQASAEPQKKVVNVLKGTMQKRHRDGYDDGDSTNLRKVSSAADFIWSHNPLEILGSVTAITFQDPASLPIKDHVLTTEEIQFLCDDLCVLGRQDFKHLLKWRMRVRKEIKPPEKESSGVAAAKVEQEGELDEDDKLLLEMEELTHAMERKKKRANKNRSKRQDKDKAREATRLQTDVMEDAYRDTTLFSLLSIKGKKDLAVVNTGDDDDDDELEDSQKSENEDENSRSSSDVDMDVEYGRYNEEIEECLDEAYDRFIAKTEGNTKRRKRAKEEHVEDDLLQGEVDAEQINTVYDSNEEDEVGNPLIVSLRRPPTKEEIANKWFSHGVFSMDAAKNEEDESKNEDSEEEALVPKHASCVPPVGSSDKGEAKARDDFTIVAAPSKNSNDDSASLSSSSSSEEEGLDEVDDEQKAEILACAKKMLRKKQREAILDEAYNRYMFHDEGLPKWFVEEEKRHWRPMKPVTKEEVAAMRAQFKELDARPTKKVAQAKARKKRIHARKMEKVRKKANVIAGQADISDQYKRKEIQRLYKKAVPQRPKKEYVVAKKGVSVRVGKGKVLVDPRMKKDKRAHGAGKPGRTGKPKAGKKMEKNKKRKNRS